jgi:primosomal protein N' (replication factor Y)
VIEHNYLDFYTNEIVERRNFFYPPFYKIIQITLKHKDIDVLNAASFALANALRDVFKERVLGPEFPIIQRIQNLYLKELKIKVERDISHVKVKDRIQEIIDQFYVVPAHKSVRMVVDVDPA